MSKRDALPFWIDIPYRAFARTAEGTANVSRLLTAKSADEQSKLLRAFTARSNLLTRYNEWSLEKRDLDRPLIWFHASSVGEGLMALPIIEELREADPTVQIAYTFFSPSAEKFASRLPVDFYDYLPFDSRRSASSIIEALRPNVIVFSKLDVWPNLTFEARKKGVKVVLTSASLPASSSRLKGVSKRISKSVFPTLDAIGAASKEDAINFESVGVQKGRLRVTGDTRYDQAWKRAYHNPRNVEFVEALCANSIQYTTLVAGSTWPADEAVLLPGWLEAKQYNSKQRLVIAPHEVHEQHILPIVRWAKASNLKLCRYTQWQAAMQVREGLLQSHETNSIFDSDVIIIDAIGILADAYKAADLAYVGGGFHKQGLHSLVEPAVFYKQTIVGPRITGSRDAEMMIAANGASIINNADDLHEAVANIRHGHSIGMQAVVEEERGATSRSVQLIRSVI